MTDGDANRVDQKVLLARMEERQISIAERVKELLDIVTVIQNTLSTSRIEIGKLQAQMKWMWNLMFLVISSTVGVAYMVTRGLP